MEGKVVATYFGCMNTHGFWRRVVGALALVAATTPTSGQITVNEGDLPQGGTSYTFQNLPIDPLMDLTSSGPGWIWDFSEELPTDSEVVDVFNITDASFTTALLFNSPWDPTHQADHFYTFLNLPDLGDTGLPVDIQNVQGYHQVSNGLYTQVGLGLTVSGFEIPVLFEDVDEVHPVPLTAYATHSSTAAYTVDVPQTFTYVVDQTRDALVDGYGTLVLPDGTSHEVLRLKSTVLSDDSVYVSALGQGFAFQRETVVYSWVSDGGMPWMEVMTTLGVPTMARYQGTNPYTEPVDTTETNRVGPACDAPSLRVHPNPVRAGDRVRLARQGEGVPIAWTVHAVNGTAVLEGRGPWLDTAPLTPGMYLVRETTTGQTRRLVVR